MQRAAIWVEGRATSLPCYVRDVKSSGALVIIDPSECPSDSVFLRFDDVNGYALCNIVWRGRSEIAVVFLSWHEKVEFKPRA